MNRKPQLQPGIAITLLLSFSTTCGLIVGGFVYLVLRGFTP